MEAGLSRIVPAPILHKFEVSKIKQRTIDEENILLTYPPCAYEITRSASARLLTLFAIPIIAMIAHAM
jgi:hypothetical protein